VCKEHIPGNGKSKPQLLKAFNFWDRSGKFEEASDQEDEDELENN